MARQRAHDTPPQLKKSSRGFWYVKWGDRMYTFGSDKAKADAAYLDPSSLHAGSLRCWQAWRAAKRQRTAAASLADRHTVSELIEAFTETYTRERRRGTADYYRKHLRRFDHAMGAWPANAIDMPAVEAWRVTLLNLKTQDDEYLGPKTISHDLKAFKTFWRWASSLHAGECQAIELSRVKVPRQPEPTPHPISHQAVQSMCAMWAHHHPAEAAWLPLMYLAALRPSEVVRIAKREGRFEPIIYPPVDGEAPRVIENGLYVLASNKVAHLTGAPRRVVLSGQALLYLQQVQQPSLLQTGRRRGRRGVRWTSLASFSQAVRDVCLHPPSVLRDSAASHLRMEGVAGEDIDSILGHLRKGAGASYIQTSWHTLRDATGRLSL